MKCKNCGGELQYQNGTWKCKSCGATGTIDSIYENVDVYICYEESDSAGRRTRDSIIAQEVYKRLENAKISTFYERISTDGMIGDELSAARYSALNKAKAVIVLGTSQENFAAIEQKYGKVLLEKIIIPFCIDINPSQIPESFCGIQAISYTSIGWDKDLINGLYNLLGRSKEIDADTVNNTKRKKTIIAVIAVLFVVLSVIATFIFVNIASDTQEPVETTQKTQKEIYDESIKALNQGKNIDALLLLSQISGYANSDTLLKQIYSKYEGFYQNNNINIRIEITDNIRANIEINILDDEQTIRIAESTKILENIITCNYLDNHQNSGEFNLQLTDDGVQFNLSADKNDKTIETFFALSEKTEQQIQLLDAETMQNWIEEKYTYNQLIALGYELEVVESMCGFEFPDDYNKLMKIKDTDIYLSMVKLYFSEDEEYRFDDRIVAGIAAPAKYSAPFLIGKECLPVFENNIIYWPNSYLDIYTYSAGFFPNYFQNSDTEISGDTIIGVSIKTNMLSANWEDLLRSVFEERVNIVAEKTYLDSNPDGYVVSTIYGENESHYLVQVNSSQLDMQCAWYKIDKQDKTVTFIREGPTTYSFIDPAQAYPDLAAEFPSAFGGTDINSSTSTDTTNIIKVKTEGYKIYSEPSYNSTIVQDLPIGAFTIIEEIEDEYGNTWGKLKSGKGWICFSDIQN